jgi:hypothetical protein
MSKRLFQIISLIFSILYLIYLFLSYNGITRYIALHVNSTESYINDYPKLEKADKDRVVVCFTANEAQLSKLKPFINSILDQTVRVDDIALTIPNKDLEKVPENLKKVLSVYGYSKDYENAGNLISSVLREPEATTKIIIVEPYMIYGQDFIEKIIQESNKHKNKIIYAHPSKLPKWGILIKPAFFDDNICHYEKGKGLCEWLSKCADAECKITTYSETYKNML